MALKIFIDQGHNPENPNSGAEANGFREQDLVYAIGQRTAAMLRGYGFDVRLSRPAPDTQLGNSVATSLAARVDNANDWGADYFISLHCNASDNTAASGTEAFVFRRNSDAEWLAYRLVQGVTDATGLPDRGIMARPGLYVLRKTRMPAVLMELGFITNPGDAALLAYSPNLFAAGLTNGLLAYLAPQ